MSKRPRTHRARWLGSTRVRGAPWPSTAVAMAVSTMVATIADAATRQRTLAKADTMLQQAADLVAEGRATTAELERFASRWHAAKVAVGCVGASAC